MLPRLKRDDLVLLRASSSYRVGEVVGYHSSLLHRVVLHRIVSIVHGRYTFKGDNNNFLDPERPTRGQLVGKLWLHVPSLGRVVPLLHVPWVAGALAALLVLALGLEREGRVKPEPDEPSQPR
jgi:signal peptidase I